MIGVSELEICSEISSDIICGAYAHWVITWTLRAGFGFPELALTSIQNAGTLSEKHMACTTIRK